MVAHVLVWCVHWGAGMLEGPTSSGACRHAPCSQAQQQPSSISCISLDTHTDVQLPATVPQSKHRAGPTQAARQAGSSQAGSSTRPAHLRRLSAGLACSTCGGSRSCLASSRSTSHWPTGRSDTTPAWPSDACSRRPGLLSSAACWAMADAIQLRLPGNTCSMADTWPATALRYCWMKASAQEPCRWSS